MRTPLTLGLFGLGLVVVFAASFGLGRLVGPAPDGGPAPVVTTPAATRTDGGHR